MAAKERNPRPLIITEMCEFVNEPVVNGAFFVYRSAIYDAHYVEVCVNDPDLLVGIEDALDYPNIIQVEVRKSDDPCNAGQKAKYNYKFQIRIAIIQYSYNESVLPIRNQITNFLSRRASEIEINGRN